MISHLSKYIAGLYRQSKKAINLEFQHLGIRATQGDLLLFINDNPGLSQKQIATMMILDPSLVGRDLKFLISAHYVKSIDAPGDSRTHQIFLTESGQKTADDLQKIVSNWWLKTLQNSPETDKDILVTQLRHLYFSLLPKS